LKAQLNTDKLLNVGANALYFKDFVLSIQYFNQVIKAKPFLDKPYLYRAIAKINLEDYTGALDDLETVIEKNEFIPMAYYAKGFIYNRLQKYDLAEKNLSKALELSPENTTYIICRLESYDYGKKYEEELRDLNFLLSKLGYPSEIALEKVRVLVVSGDTLGAFEVADKLLQKDSANADAWGGRALINIFLDKKEEALSDYNQAIKRNSTNPSHFINRGILHYQKHNYNACLSDYNKAAALSPTNEQVFFNRSLLRTEIGDYNNAVADLDKVIEINPEFYEAVYQRAIVNQQLGNMRKSIDDFSKIIEQYPDFVPAYQARAFACGILGDKKASYADTQKALKIEEDYKKNRKETKALDTDAKIAHQKSAVNMWAKLFASSQSEAEDESRYTNNILRGNVQNRNADVEMQNDFVISPYQKNSPLRETKYFFHLLNQINVRNKKDVPLKFVNDEVALTDALINYHFKTIDEISDRIEKDAKNPDLYFLRGINNALVQDFNSSLEDFSTAILCGADALAYFCRAVVRSKQLEVSIAGLPAEQSGVKNSSKPANVVDKKFANDYEMIFRDYDKALELAPDFAFAWFNRGNILCSLRDYKSAISCFSNAVSLNPDFAEAYFNRALTFIYVGENEKGAADLSKAGELGIYQAYNLLKKMAK
jgi:tetratricopeptide (TPR) repeat protein